jgi:oligogalacturonide lyase
VAEDFAIARSLAKTGGNLSWMEALPIPFYGPQWNHPHPSWSANKTRSFASGATQVYGGRGPPIPAVAE